MKFWQCIISGALVGLTTFLLAFFIIQVGKVNLIFGSLLGIAAITSIQVTCTLIIITKIEELKGKSS